jgi:hypothetical protein
MRCPPKVDGQMTDARLPERWLNDRRLQRLSADHYRTFINALLWSVANRTDGRIEREDVGLIPHWSGSAAKAFVSAELFTPQSGGWLITDYASTQSARSELERLEKLRAGERIKKAKQRAKKLAEDGDAPGDDEPVELDVPVDIPGDGPVDMSPGTHQAGRQAGRKASKGSSSPAADSTSDSGLFVVNGGKPPASTFLENH